MALSGNQITGTGVIGFPGQAYLGFTAKAPYIPPPPLTFGVLSFMDWKGQGVIDTISQSGIGVVDKISQSMGVLSIIDNKGKGVKATISQTGIGVEDKL